ncbi:MAG: hypothetical protein Unbinned6224contig1003_12 [Prokaryotic dsDNA virus sp.]|nr:MAG: hypothetical protein Unbinned6224contig1003_12 [Prokaryotic dsDNA virus sp.]|tara:strand:+ start:4515 stop:5225 length:711 start_codon:yes stop_codon:yes gene_type:complete
MNYEIKNVKINSLKEFPDNPRSSNLESIKISLEKHGQYRPLTVNKNNNEILTGNHTWLAMKELGYETCDVMFVDVDDIKARKIVLVDNRLNELATYDKTKLSNMLGDLMELGALFGTGFSADEVDNIFNDTEKLEETDFEEFTGGFALTDDEIADIENRIQKPTEKKSSEHLNEIILALHKEEYENYKTNIDIVANGLSISHTEALFFTVVNLAKEINSGSVKRPNWLGKIFNNEN